MNSVMLMYIAHLGPNGSSADYGTVERRLTEALWQFITYGFATGFMCASIRISLTFTDI